MPLTTIVLSPYDQSDGTGSQWEIVDTPTYFGGGSLSDDSDATGATIGAELDLSSNHHGEPVAVYFKTPSGFDPFAFLIQTRMKNDPDVLPPNAEPFGTRQMVTYLRSADGTSEFDYELVSPGGGDPSPISEVLVPPWTTTPTWFTWWAQSGAGSIDLDDPSQAGGWYQLDWTYSGDAGDKDALTGDGLRLDIGLYFSGVAGDPHLNWFELYEVRLLVAGAAAATGTPPLLQYPRADGRGAGPRRLHPRPPSARAAGHF